MPESFERAPSRREGSLADRIACFGPFEFNLNAIELRRQGRIVSTQQQSLRILACLIERAGTTVTREELQLAVWPAGTFVEFESSLYTAVNRLRLALGDSAGKPYFIETVPKVGYRFISPVQMSPPLEPNPAIAPQSLAIPPGSSGRRRAVSVWLGLAVLLVSGVVCFTLWRRLQPAPPALDNLRPFTMARGAQDHPTFSPDGETLAYDWNSPNPVENGVFVQRVESGTPARLTKDAGNERRPVWSRDGRQIAFLRSAGPDMFAIISIPLVGTGERKLAEFRKGASPWFDWSADGKWFAVAEPSEAGRAPAIVLISCSMGDRHSITNPPSAWRGDSLPQFSPDSKTIAFRRTLPPSGVEDIYSVPIDGGAPKRLTFDNRMVQSFAFTPDGGLLFSSKRGSSISALWWLAPQGGRLTRLTAPTFAANSPTVSRDGKHVAFSRASFDVNIWRVNTEGAGAAVPLIDSPLPDTGAQFSPDGRRIAFHSVRSGNDEIWVSDASGANPVRLTDGRGFALGNPRWSPDGRRLAFEWQPAGRSEIYVIASDGGPPRKLVADAFQNSVPSWSHDGRFVYFASTRSGQRAIWKVSAEGGVPAMVTKGPDFAPVESPDGKYLYNSFT